jgi:signal transduction histidine kinase/HD-like signal output (HDOD) protein
MAGVSSQISEQELTQLISAPQVVVQLLWASHSGDFSAQDLQNIILQDSVFCARILNLAVKSVPGALDSFAPLSSALEALSLPMIKSLAIQSARLLVTRSFTAGQIQLMRELWFYSQVAGITSRCLAEAIAYPDPEEAQLAGLMANFGMSALFARDPEQYLTDVVRSLSSTEVRKLERLSFESDHIQIADLFISGWQFDSFMSDAIRFLHLEVEQCREASPLIRIVRFALEVCRSPFDLTAEICAVAEKLFGLSAADTERIYTRAEADFRSLSPFQVHQVYGLEEFKRDQKRLSAVVFSIADQENIRLQLVDSVDVQALAGRARNLYLHHSPAREAVFFAFEAQTARIFGIASGEQTRLVAELMTSLNAVNLLAEALKSSKIRHSFEPGAINPSVFDLQLIRLCKGRGIVCLPLLDQGRLLGGLVLGVEDESEADFFATPRMQLLSGPLARALAFFVAPQPEPTPSSAARGDSRLLHKLMHELSNPLTVISSHAGLAGTQFARAENMEHLAVIEREVTRIGEILDYYSELKERSPLPEAAIALDRLIPALIESLSPTLFVPKELQIHTYFDASLPPVKTKALAIQQILVNLLKNAAEVLQPGGSIVLEARQHTTSAGGSFVEICVKDNGPGIDSRIRDRLFSPVISTKGAGHSGLGLSIVKGMVDDIGAKISCHSSTAFGTWFKLEIPIIN